MATRIYGILGDKPIPAGYPGRPLTEAEMKRLRAAGHRVGRTDFIMQYGAGPHCGVLYYSARGGACGGYNSGLVLQQESVSGLSVKRV